jgi:hypothetical protein
MRPAVGASVMLAVLALSAAGLIRQFARPAPDEWFAHDQQVYLAMTRAPFADDPETRRAPASWRILPTLIARAIGQATGRGPEFGFLVLTFASFALIPIAARALLIRLGVTAGVAGLCGAFAALAPPILGYLSWDVVRIDAFGVLLIYVTAIAAVAESRAAVAVALIALSLTKETMLLGAFFAIGWSALFARRMLPAALLAAGVGALIRFVVLPTWLPPPSIDGFASANGLRGVIESMSLRYVGRRVLLASSSTFNLLLPLAAAAVVRERWSARTWVLAAAVGVGCAQILFASDTQRVVAAAYPFVLALCAFEIDRMSERGKMIAGAVLLVGQLPWLIVYGRILPDLPGIRVVEILIFLSTAALIAVLWRRGSVPDDHGRTKRRPSIRHSPSSTNRIASG